MQARMVIPLLLFVAGTLTARTARADVFRDVAYGLGLAGFELEGSRNILSGGRDFLINNNFIATPLDFGVGELRLQGPVSLSLSTGQRGLRTFDFSLRTALNADAPASALAYAFNLDTGGQRTDVSGTTFLDANVHLDGFGFYDIELTYSSRQTVDREGRFANSSDDYDADVGPISVSGNIFADALAFLTAPIFAATNTPNIFANFSDTTALKEIILATTGAARANLASGDASVLVTGPLQQALAAQLGLTAGGAEASAGASRSFGAAVPEPTVLLLMLLGVPVVLRRQFRRHPSYVRSR